MMKLILPLAALTLAAPALATTPISATVSAGMSVKLGELSGGDGETLTFVPLDDNTRMASASAFVGERDGSPFAAAGVSASASWDSPSRGFVGIFWDWRLTADNSQGPAEFATGLNTPNWSYSFTATRDGYFRGRYFVSYSGDQTDGLGGVIGGGDLDGLRFGGGEPLSSGDFAVRLQAGRDYTMTLSNAGFLAVPGGGEFASAGGGLFDWRITAVPEPATWAMMIAGFGMVGAALRRRAALPA